MALHYNVNRLAETFRQVSRMDLLSVHMLSIFWHTCWPVKIPFWKHLVQMLFDGECLFCQILGRLYQGSHEGKRVPFYL